MYTGTGEFEDIGQIAAWNFNTTVNNTYPFECSKLSGSAGEFFSPNREKTFADFFTPDVCRTISFIYEDTVDVKGIKGYRHILDDSFVGNSTYYPENWCYNPYPATMTSDFYLPNGLLNVSACKFGSPAYVSYPHFYMADPILIDSLHSESDLHPSQESHESSLTLEPSMGIPLEVNVRLQINGLLRDFFMEIVDAVGNPQNMTCE